MEQKEIIEVAAGVVFRDGRFLITRRPESTHQGGLWEFPGGKLQPGESLRDCLRRELREELGVSVQVGEVLKIVEHSYPDRRVRLHFYRCSIPDPFIPDRLTFRWVSPSDLSQLEFPEANSSLIQDLQNYS